jgi:putative redox protein
VSFFSIFLWIKNQNICIKGVTMDLEVRFEGNKKINAYYKGHVIKTDQSEKAGGDNTAPAPFDIFLASIGTCAGIYIKSFCDRRDIPTDGIRIIQTAEYDRESGLPVNISLDIKLPADFPEKYKSAVINAADLCKVKKTLVSPPEFKVFTSPAG